MTPQVLMEHIFKTQDTPAHTTGNTAVLQCCSSLTLLLFQCELLQADHQQALGRCLSTQVWIIGGLIKTMISSADWTLLTSCWPSPRWRTTSARTTCSSWPGGLQSPPSVASTQALTVRNISSRGNIFTVNIFSVHWHGALHQLPRGAHHRHLRTVLREIIFYTNLTDRVRLSL